MVRKLFIICLFLLTGWVDSSASFATQRAKPLLIIDLIPHPGGTDMMVMHAKVRGHEGTFLLDTGGGISYITPGFAQTIGCKPWGQISGFTLTGQRIDMPRCDELSFGIQDQHFSAPISGVFDVMKFMKPNVPPLDGSIGLDIFVGRTVTLSLMGRKLFVESAVSAQRRIRQGKEVPIRLVREVNGVALAVQVGVPTSEGMAWMELDSGNGGANVIAKHLAPLIKLDPSKKEPQPASFQIAGGIPVEGKARVNDTLTMDGNIGTSFMLKWDLTLDLAKSRAWLAPAKNT